MMRRDAEPGVVALACRRRRRAEEPRQGYARKRVVQVSHGNCILILFQFATLSNHPTIASRLQLDRDGRRLCAC
jgi:hypothetical protein